MSSVAITGIGSLFRRWTGSAWANMAEVVEIDGPKKSRDTIEVTHLGSTDGYKDYIGGLRDGGTISAKLNFTRASYDLMNTDYESDDVQNYEIVLVDDDSTTFEFEGLVTELGIAVTAKDAIIADVSIKISGQVTVNSGASSGLTS